MLQVDSVHAVERHEAGPHPPQATEQPRPDAIGARHPLTSTGTPMHDTPGKPAPKSYWRGRSTAPPISSCQEPLRTWGSIRFWVTT